MRITKDEAVILAECLYEQKFDLGAKYLNREKKGELFDACGKLGERLIKYSEDSRRKGRTTQNDFSDVLKRFIVEQTKKSKK